MVVAGATARGAAADPAPPAPPAPPDQPQQPPAPPPDDAAAAAAHLTAGTAAYDAQDWDTAARELQAAYDASHDAMLLFQIATAEQHLNHSREAIRAFARYLREGGDRVPADRREVAIAAINDLRTLVGEVTIVVDGGPAQIEVDGHVEGQAPLDHPLVLAKGAHHVLVTRGPAKAERDIQVKGGDKLGIELIPIELPDGQLTVHTKPDGAELVVDKDPRGPAPWQGTLVVGPHKLTATMIDFRPVEQTVTIAGGDKQEITLQLTALPKQTHWYAHWYVPVAAALVVGSVALTVHELSRNDDLVIEFH
jgi:hypothetical protein